MKANSEVSIANIREALDYDPDTGIFTWRKASPKKPYLIGRQAGRISPHGYVRIQLEGKAYMAHRLAWAHVYGEWPLGCIDHINGAKSDNSISNLRDVSLSANQQNRRSAAKNNRHGLLGVHRQPGRSMFYAMIKVGEKNRYLGSFKTEAEAHEAYLLAKRKLHAGCTI